MAKKTGTAKKTAAKKVAKAPAGRTAKPKGADKKASPAKKTVKAAKAPASKTPGNKTLASKAAAKSTTSKAPAAGSSKASKTASAAPKKKATTRQPEEATVKAAAPASPAPAAETPKKKTAKAAPEPKAAAAIVEPKVTESKPAKAEPKAAPADEATGDKGGERGGEKGADKKGGPKGITVVQPKPSKPAKPKPKFQLPQGEPLLRPGMKWTPLIPSGPSAAPQHSLEIDENGEGQKFKMPKKELERYRQILLRKRAELLGDITAIEDEALRQNSGGLSHTPQHMAENGTETFDQALSLDLAQVDRNLLREIDAALKRIEEGTYGLCELTGKPISSERLEELPWARYSIEAARELERRPFTS